MIMLKRINPALPQLIVGILLYGIVIQITGMWFVNDKQAYTLGLWIGIALAIGMAINMAIVILDAVDAAATTGNGADRVLVGAALCGCCRCFCGSLVF